MAIISNKLTLKQFIVMSKIDENRSPFKTHVRKSTIIHYKHGFSINRHVYVYDSAEVSEFISKSTKAYNY